MSVANYLLGATRFAVLKELFLQPESALHVRELARITGASPGSLHRDLRALADLGLLLREEVGRQVHYQANPACPVFDELAALLQKATDTPPRSPNLATSSETRVLHDQRAAYEVSAPRPKLHIPRGKLASLCRKYRIRKLSLFGSAARNEMTPSSDVDVLVEFEQGGETSLLDIPAMQDELSTLFGGRKVDVATPEILDNPFRRKAILPELRTLYAA
ncbi:MAG: nucleotidyltransferase domain-containing protein [Burkholderiales bacterium]|nr:nucleotidyltransferase domain-containing protein [Burkholderiales bacterium]